jgi:hypothetical protein
MAHGYGEYFHLNGRNYRGGWQNDMKHGYGEEIMPDTSKYKGDFFEGKK